jgi:hypothetical protein
MSAPIKPTSAKSATPAVDASNTSVDGGLAVHGYAEHGHGVEGGSTKSKGVVGTSVDYQGVYGHSDKNAGVVGESAAWVGVYGKSMGDPGIAVMGEARVDQAAGVSGNGTGVFGASTRGHGVEGSSNGSKGVVGTSVEYQGVYGHSDKNAGVVGESATWVGVYGRSMSPDRGAAVMGDATTGAGVAGSGTAVLATTTSGRGVHASSQSGEAIHAETQSHDVAAIAAYNHNPDGTGAAIFAQKDGENGTAGYFVGDVVVTGKLTVRDLYLTGADVAERFEVTDDGVEPGTVMVLEGDDLIRVSRRAYDPCVAGVLSGAGTYRPGVVLDVAGGRTRRSPLALVGKAFCKVDASYGAIRVGDLLTTSDTAGHAMRATQPSRTFGAVLGKAMASVDDGTACIPILVGLH